MAAARSTPRPAPRPALFSGDTHSITSNQTGGRQAQPRPSTAHESYGGARSHLGTRHPDARSGAGALRHRVAQAAGLGKRSSRSVDRCSRHQRMMRTARRGGFADESARGSSCRGVSARHAETSALTKPIAKASPPRYCWLGRCGVRSISLARQQGSSRLRCQLEIKPEMCWHAFASNNCTILALAPRESLLASIFTDR